eukprot:gene23413-30688_t
MGNCCAKPTAFEDRSSDGGLAPTTNEIRGLEDIGNTTIHEGAAPKAVGAVPTLLEGWLSPNSANSVAELSSSRPGLPHKAPLTDGLSPYSVYSVEPCKIVKLNTAGSQAQRQAVPNARLYAGSLSKPGRESAEAGGQLSTDNQPGQQAFASKAADSLSEPARKGQTKKRPGQQAFASKAADSLSEPARKGQSKKRPGQQAIASKAASSSWPMDWLKQLTQRYSFASKAASASWPMDWLKQLPQRYSFASKAASASWPMDWLKQLKQRYPFASCREEPSEHGGGSCHKARSSCTMLNGLAKSAKIGGLGPGGPGSDWGVNGDTH